MSWARGEPRDGHFGTWGGRFVPEALMAPLDELALAYEKAINSRGFQRRLRELLTHYAGRPTPLHHARRLSDRLGGAQIWLKREDLLHTGAHTLNNAIGQVLLAQRMKKARVIAETGAGQHGVATATAAALLGLECIVYVGANDMERQRLHVDRMRLLGADVVPVEAGSRALKDATNEALRDWVTNAALTHYVLGSALGPDPYPRMVRDFHRPIGEEARRQLKRQAGRAAPDLAIACVGGGGNALGLFAAYLDDRSVRLVGVEAGGRNEGLGEHASRFLGGSPGVVHGARTYVMQDGNGQIATTHSIAIGLDSPAVGPELAALHEIGRVEYTAVGDAEAVAAFHLLAECEGLLPALESAHAVAEAVRRAPRLGSGRLILVNLSGRGDKDLDKVEGFDRERKHADSRRGVNGPVPDAVADETVGVP